MQPESNVGGLAAAAASAQVVNTEMSLRGGPKTQAIGSLERSISMAQAQAQTQVGQAQLPAGMRTANQSIDIASGAADGGTAAPGYNNFGRQVGQSSEHLAAWYNQQKSELVQRIAVIDSQLHRAQHDRNVLRSVVQMTLTGDPGPAASRDENISQKQNPAAGAGGPEEVGVDISICALDNSDYGDCDGEDDDELGTRDWGIDLELTRRVLHENSQRAMLANKALHHMQMPQSMIGSSHMADSGSLTVPLYTSPQEASVWDANEAYFQENKDALRDLLFRSAAEQNKASVEMATHYIKKRNSWLKKLAKADGAANESTKVASVVKSIKALKRNAKEPKAVDVTKKEKEHSTKTAPSHRYPSRNHAVSHSSDFVASEFEQELRLKELMDKERRDSDRKYNAAAIPTMVVLQPFALSRSRFNYKLTLDGANAICADVKLQDRCNMRGKTKKKVPKSAIPSKVGCNCSIAHAAEYRSANPWSDVERLIFIDKFLQYPKHFPKIASFLANKSTRDVICYYYNSKKRCNYKNLLREQHSRRAVGHRLPHWALIVSAAQQSGIELPCSVLRGPMGPGEKYPQVYLNHIESIAAENAEARLAKLNMVRGPGRRRATVNDRVDRLNDQDDDIKVDFADYVLETDYTPNPVVADSTFEAWKVSAGSKPWIKGKGKKVKKRKDHGDMFQQPRPSKKKKKESTDMARRVKKAKSSTKISRDKAIAEKKKWMVAEKANRASMKGVQKWVPSEKKLFLSLFASYGKDWLAIAGTIKTKTVSQVKNYYQNYKHRLGLNEILEHREKIMGRSDK